MPRWPEEANATGAAAPEVAGKLMDWSQEGHEVTESLKMEKSEGELRGN